MGKLTGNWITGAHSGRACKHDSIYTRVNKKTGAIYSAKLCNPNYDRNAAQQNVANGFGLAQTAIAQWISANKIASGSAHADYVKVKKAFDAQRKYGTLRGFMLAKGMYTVSGEGSSLAVAVDISARSDFKEAFGEAVYYTLTISTDTPTDGSVNTSVNGQYRAGSQVTIIATPKSSNEYLEQWSDGSYEATRVITMDADKTLVAHFNARM